MNVNEIRDEAAEKVEAGKAWIATELESLDADIDPLDEEYAKFLKRCTPGTTTVRIPIDDALSMTQSNQTKRGKEMYLGARRARKMGASHVHWQSCHVTELLSGSQPQPVFGTEDE